MHTVHCTLYTGYCTYTLYTVYTHCTLYIYTAHCTLYIYTVHRSEILTQPVSATATKMNNARVFNCETHCTYNSYCNLDNKNHDTKKARHLILILFTILPLFNGPFVCSTIKKDSLANFNITYCFSV